MAKRNQNTTAPVIDTTDAAKAEIEKQATDLRTAAIEAGLSLSMGEAAAAQMATRAEASEKTLSSYFSFLLLKFAKSEVTTTTDARKKAVVPALDKHLATDEVAMMQRVNAMSDEEMATYGWKRETKMVKGRAVTDIEGYKVSRSWIQYKTNTRTAIINGTAARFADDKNRNDAVPVPMARVMELNRDATRTDKLAAAVKQHDATTIAKDVMSRLADAQRALTAKPETEAEKQAADRACNRYAIAVCKFAEAINEALNERGMTAIDIRALQGIVNGKQLPKLDKATKPAVAAVG